MVMMVLVVIAVIGIVLYFLGRYINAAEGLICAIIVAVLVASNTAGIHMLFRILLTIIAASVVFSIVWVLFRNEAGFWILNSIFSLGYAFVISSLTWSKAHLLDWGIWSFKLYPEDFPNGLLEYDGDLIWTIFAVIASFAISFGLHYRAKNELEDLDI